MIGCPIALPGTISNGFYSFLPFKPPFLCLPSPPSITLPSQQQLAYGYTALPLHYGALLENAFWFK